jgi:hypothetical protein
MLPYKVKSLKYFFGEDNPLKNLQENYNKVLEKISDELDISPTNYQKAVKSYEHVANWLNDSDDSLLNGNLHIYPQGSFRLGTVIRPIIGGVEANYDIDLVCKLPILKESTNPQTIKELIGERLKEHGTFRKMLDDEGKRCWTLEYAENNGIGFHIDILPSIQEGSDIVSFIQQFVPFSIAVKSIAITDKSKSGYYDWETSNPDGYAEWFDEVKKPIFRKLVRSQKEYLFSENVSFYNSIDDVPDQLVKTPLQRAIQILKRHRDIRFLNHELESDKPISMIITTLAAKLYEQEEDVYTTLKNIVEKLDDYSQLLNLDNIQYFQEESYNIIKRGQDGKWYIPNPVNPNENFADRWHENGNRRANAFFYWIRCIKTDIIDILKLGDMQSIGKSLEYSFGETATKRALGRINGSNNYPSIIVPVNFKEPEEIANPTKPWRKNAE